MSNYEFEEEEFTTQINRRTILRIIAQAKPHWPLLVSFLTAIAAIAALDAVFTFISKRIIDEGIVARDTEALMQLVILYGSLILFSAFGIFTFIYMAGRLGEQIQYDLRQKMFARLPILSGKERRVVPEGPVSECNQALVAVGVALSTMFLTIQ